MEKIKYYKDKNGVIYTGSKGVEFDEGQDFIEISKKEYTDIEEGFTKKLSEEAEIYSGYMARMKELQSKAVLEGLTDKEKDEYKELAAKLSI